MKNLKLISILFSAVVVVALSCSKGSTGPQGPQGPAGPDSVLYSTWVSLNTPFNNTDSAYEETISASSITQGILDSGLIISYFDIPDNSGNDQVFTTSSVGLVVSETYSVGQVSLFSSVDLTGIMYRYVIVPGSHQAGNVVSGPAKGMTLKQLQGMSYADLEKLLAGYTNKIVSN